METAEKKLHLMGTIIIVWVKAKNPQDLLDMAEKKLIDYESRFSANAKSHLTNINDNAGIRPVKIESDLFELIKIGKEQSLIRNSALNIAIGPLIQAWRIGFNDARYPGQARINELLKLIDPADIILDETNQTIFLKHKQMSLDLGAIAKGYFADKIINYFKSQQASAGFISLGGNVLTFGDEPDHLDGMWRIGVQNPFLPRGNFVATLKVLDKSVVTSGIYERKFVFKGHTYHHIFDTSTGYPIKTNLESITIVADKSIDCEIWTTRLFGQNALKAVEILNKLDGIDGVVVTTDGQMAYSDGLKKKITLVQ
ncbi:FAD:protein FMN transferase [Companilactobacillus allii]|uniref:FAD:protein FMN transferase n=1 Tax=Companilactobacillus allii TaxID=1847728 RepID=A0A1P8Q1U3_9LACO|nr:FAD:protein FMN transferase [Companilactobacillus allii]APX71759.1 thiamine biosynthesis protein ApbE [Companilactobacillus allii]USQ68846.1 FAD:protein FMN transferase [Companilactobacillus allii]